MTNEMPETIWIYISSEVDDEKFYNATDWKSDIIEETQYTRGKPVDFDTLEKSPDVRITETYAVGWNECVKYLKDNGYRIVK